MLQRIRTIEKYYSDIMGKFCLILLKINGSKSGHKNDSKNRDR